jgi:hypothetical protein
MFYSRLTSAAIAPAEHLSPCSPSPCGANAQCREQNGAGACTCLQDYIGNPYEGCRPECVLNSDCPYNKACIKNKCQDPCPGTCGQNAICQVVNHLPSCTCNPGYTGDPFRYCNLPPPERKTLKPWNQLLFTWNLHSCSRRTHKSVPAQPLRSQQPMSRSQPTGGVFLFAQICWKSTRL